jgi:hypothetical protein
MDNSRAAAPWWSTKPARWKPARRVAGVVVVTVVVVVAAVTAVAVAVTAVAVAVADVKAAAAVTVAAAAATDRIDPDSKRALGALFSWFFLIDHPLA